MQTSQQTVEYNPSELTELELTNIGLRLTREVLTQVCELFKQLKVLQPPNPNFLVEDKKLRIPIQIQEIKSLFADLGKVYSVLEETSTYHDIEGLIPLDEKKEKIVISNPEFDKLKAQVEQRNRQLKESINLLRTTIREISVMLAVRNSEHK